MGPVDTVWTARQSACIPLVAQRIITVNAVVAASAASDDLHRAGDSAASPLSSFSSPRGVAARPVRIGGRPTSAASLSARSDSFGSASTPRLASPTPSTRTLAEPAPAPAPVSAMLAAYIASQLDKASRCEISLGIVNRTVELATAGDWDAAEALEKKHKADKMASKASVGAATEVDG